MINLLKKLTIILGAITSFSLALPAFAQTNIAYPVLELGSCRDAKECYLYCEIPRHQLACQQYSSSHNLSAVLGATTQVFRQRVLQAATALKINFPIAELGNCEGPEACRAYCAEAENRDACKVFARNHGLRRQRAIGKITYPIEELGNCESRQACKTYCQEEANRDTCKAFARDHGIRVRKKVHQLLQKAKEELGCETLEECKAFCTNPENQVRCRSFGLRHRRTNQQQTQDRLNQLRENSPSTATIPGAIRPNIKDRLRQRFQTIPSQSPPPQPMSPNSVAPAPNPAEVSY